MANTKRKPYRSPLREEQVNRTRVVVLEGLMSLVNDEGVEGLSVRGVAERADVSERTVYRYFPDRAALLDGLADWLDEQMGSTSVAADVRSADELAGMVPVVFEAFDELEERARAMVLLSEALHVRTASHDRRTEEFRETLADLDGVEGDQLEQLLALVRLLVSARTWLVLKEEFGLEGSAAGQLIAWAVRTLLAEARDRGVGPTPSTVSPSPPPPG